MNIKKISYRVTAVAEGGQLDLTDLTAGLTWSEGAKELAAKIQLKLVITDDIEKLIQPATQIIIYADTGGGFEEVIRGGAQKIELVESNKEYLLQVECGDEAHALRHSQDDMYFTDGHESTAILEKILSETGADFKIDVEGTTHAKKVYRKKYYSDMIDDVLQDLKEKNGGVYFIRAAQGKLEVIPRGTNEQIFSFDTDTNVVKVKQSIDASKVATKIKVIGKEKVEGHPSVEAVVEGNTALGTRQVIYHRADKETLEEAETAAKKILNENKIELKTEMEAPDVPTLRKGDKIRLSSSLGEQFFYVKSIRHDAAAQKMSLELDAVEETPYDLAEKDESNSGAAP